MSRIQIECDCCGYKVELAVRQNHEARKILGHHYWISKDVSSPTGAKKEDYCPDCLL